MNRLSRRQLLKRGALALAGGVAAPHLIPAGVLASGDQPGANDRVGIGAIGVGGRARLLLDQLPPDGRIVALCDCNLPRAEAFKAKQQASWPVLQNYRKLLERKDIDAVIIATGEFQRVLPSMDACLAGKDVYAEKPLTLYIQEGRALVNLVRRCGRVFQVGTQQRSMAMNRIACELVRGGGLGKVLEVRMVNFPSSQDGPAQPFPAEKPPAGLDWDMWLNQGSWRPFNEKWMGWMSWRDFAGGEITNWGAHACDQVQWALGMDGTGPVEARPLTAGPNGQVELRYANAVPVRFVLEHRPMGGAIFVCEKESWRSTATSSLRIRRASRRNCARRSTSRKKSGNGATTSRSGRPAGISRIGLTAPRPASGPWPTWKSATARSPSATWSTLPGRRNESCNGTRKRAFRRRRPGQPLRHPPAPQGLRTADLVSPRLSPFAPRK